MTRCITRSITLKEDLHHDRAGNQESATEEWEAGWPAMTSLRGLFPGALGPGLSRLTQQARHSLPIVTRKVTAAASTEHIS